MAKLTTNCGVYCKIPGPPTVTECTAPRTGMAASDKSATPATAEKNFMVNWLEYRMKALESVIV